MIRLFKLIWILCDRRITGVPLSVLAELRKRGKRRVPEAVEKEFAKSKPGMSTFRFARKWLAGENLTRHNGKWVLNSFMPPFPSRAFDRMFEALLSGRRLNPVSAFLAVTARCTFECPHCSSRKRKSAELDSETWRSAIRQLLDLHCAIIGFTGGDPILREDLPELIRQASSGGAAVILFTTGHGFDEETAARLREAGLWAVCFSLDRANPDEFNRFRNHVGAFEFVLDAVQVSLRHGFYTMLGAVATPEFADRERFRELHDLASEWGVHELRIVEAMPCGMLRDAPDATFLSPAEIAKLRAFHTETNRRGLRPKVCAFNQIESPEFFGCTGGTQHLYIDSAGEVCPCDFTPMSFGNITEEPLEKIWLRMSESLGNPRRECIVRTYYKKINEKSRVSGSYPLKREDSCALCGEFAKSGLPDYFRLAETNSAASAK